jgi:hypothetical protein
MHKEIKRKLRARAESIGRLATHILNHFDGDEEVAAAMKFAWLMLRGPRSLRQRWGDDDLEIDEAGVRGFVWQHQNDLGIAPCHLLPEEQEIIAWHNGQASIVSSSGVIERTNVIELYSPPLT